MVNKEYIDRFIDFYTDDKVKSRGKALYRSKKVYLTSQESASEFGIEKTISKFKVEGSRFYDVAITHAKNNVSTSCSCPYDWGTICKHTVAALLFLKDNNDISTAIPLPAGNEKPKIKKPKRKSNDPYFIADYKLITEDLANEHYGRKVINQIDYWNKPEITQTELSHRNITFVIHYAYCKYEVKIDFVGNGINILSDEWSNTGRLKASEAICLFLIAQTSTPNLFDIVFSEQLNELKAQMAARFGITDFEKFFEIKYNTTSGLYASQINQNIKLIPVNGDDIVFDFLNEDNKPEEFSITTIAKKEKRDLGFVVETSLVDDYEAPIIPIIAKSSKNGKKFSTHYEVYEPYLSDTYRINISSSAQKLLNYIDNYNTVGKESLYELIKNEEFVFINKRNYNRISKNNLLRVKVSNYDAVLVYKIIGDNEFITACQKIKINEAFYNIDNFSEEYSGEQALFKDNELFFVSNKKHRAALAEYPSEFKMAIDYKNDFFDKVISPLANQFEIDYSDGPFEYTSLELDFNKRQLYLSEHDEYIVFTPQVVYKNSEPIILSRVGNIVEKNNGSVNEYIRNNELEDDYINLIAGIHPNFESQKQNKIFYLHNEDFLKNKWFYEFFDKLSAYNIEVYGIKQLKNFKYSPFKGTMSTSISSGQDWFDIEVNVAFGDNTVSLVELKKAIIHKQKYIQLKDGSVGILPEEWMHKLEKYFRNARVNNEKLELSKLRFSIIDELFDEINDAKILNELAEKKQRISKFKEVKNTKVPAKVKATLRNYQKEGLNWLNFLDEMQWGGILADDMGLGKTLQVLTFIQHMVVKNKTPNLIVVPTTLIFNWKVEIEKFTPTLRAFYYYGNDREKDVTSFKKQNMVITTYGILLRDIEILKDFQFNYVILDESQAIKNPAARRYKAANLLKAKNRLALTGTPIENSTFDLFAQMNFVNPGVFGSINNFKENYSNPIDKEGDEIVASELQHIINPLILRRTKENVATELPAKTESVIYCEMGTEQRKVYDAYRNDYRKKLLNEDDGNDIEQNKLLVLEALTRLRQICDSPALISKNNEGYSNESVKIKEIVTHVTEKTAKHKVLIFSQFVEMLSLVKNELARLNIPFEYLDGKCSTKKREQSVNNFQNNDNLRVFLISLKAGGTGLNLTAADYVYLLDPWWNPAVENQAIDRCYRIGQDKKVFAYRMICKDTIEEKILDLQNKKKKVAGDIIKTDESILKSLNYDDIKNLFC